MMGKITIKLERYFRVYCRPPMGFNFCVNGVGNCKECRRNGRVLFVLSELCRIHKDKSFRQKVGRWVFRALHKIFARKERDENISLGSSGVSDGEKDHDTSVVIDIIVSAGCGSEYKKLKEILAQAALLLRDLECTETSESICMFLKEISEAEENISDLNEEEVTE